MTRDELLSLLARLRQATVAGRRVPHKPLLLLWLFGRFAATGSSTSVYQQAAAPVSQLINEFGPPVASPAAARQRAAMPFVLLLDRHFTPTLSDLICDAVDLDVAELSAAGVAGAAPARRSIRRSGFAEEVLRAYAYACAMCGFDGALGRTGQPAVDLAYVNWHSVQVFKGGHESGDVNPPLTRRS